MDEMISVKEASEILGVNTSRVRVFIDQGRLPAVKVGHYWVLLKSDVEAFAKIPRDDKGGRPPKEPG